MFRPRIYDSLAGLLAAGLALGVAELVAALTSATSLITAVGNIVVDYTPGPLVKATIDALGTADKPVLLASIVLASLALGAVLGPLARDRRWVAAVAFGGFGLAGAIAGASDPLSSDIGSFATAAAAAIVGWLAVDRLLDAATLEAATPAAPAIETATTETDTIETATTEADTIEAAPRAGRRGRRAVRRQARRPAALPPVRGRRRRRRRAHRRGGPPAPRCGRRCRGAARRDRAADRQGVGAGRLRRRGR